MQIFSDLNQLADSLGQHRTVVTIGVFDGMHLGHQALVTSLGVRARQEGLASLVITFPEHPLSVLAPPYCPKKLIYRDRKHQVLDALGVDILAEIAFTERFASWQPEAFIDQVLVGQCHAKVVICGYDFTFGRAGAGNIELLKHIGQSRGFDVVVVEAVAEHDVLVKSTQVRDLLFSGEVEKAAHLLTRPYELRGEVITGFQRGRTIGFPTANLKTDAHRVIPAIGVYLCAARAHGEDALHAAMVNIGHNPTFGLEHLSIEAHLLDYSADLTGQILELHFLRRLRDERKFSGVQELVQQLKRDEELSRASYISKEVSDQLANI
ncbi:MAG: bifunctional riboflavin kinase/FAD synthetase [Candidatus Sumerlaeaceae bacterium]